MSSGTPIEQPDSTTSGRSRLRVLMFTDLVDSTGLKSHIKTAGYLPLLQVHDEILRAAVAGSGGQLQQDTGDGCFAFFSAASDAVTAALVFQWQMQTRAWPSGQNLCARVGIHSGEVAETEIRQDGGRKLVGLAVDLAARVMSLASGGQILLSRGAFDDARQFVTAHPGSEVATLRFVAHGPYLLKGSDEPLDIFEVGVEGQSPLAPPPDSQSGRRAIRPGDEQTLGWRPAVSLPLPGNPLWLLDQQIGVGGFGEVWLARHAKIKDRVRVFKFCFDPERLRALKREVVLFRLLKEAVGDRRDIARVLEWRLDESPYFIEMEYAPEGNLTDWVKQVGGFEKLSLEVRLNIVADVAIALAAAHSVGILHKDIKPSNVLMVRDAMGAPFPRLTDFGIGILTDRERLKNFNITAAGFTASNLTINDSSGTGTRMYSPPEALAGKPHTVQGDIYALGMLLYQMVVGDFSRPLGVGWEREVSEELVREDIAAAVEGDPERRLSNAVDLARRLQTLEERRAERLRDKELEDAERRAGELEREARRRRKLMAAIVAAAVVLAFAVLAFAVLLRDASAKRREADDARHRADENFALARRAIQTELQTGSLLSIDEAAVAQSPPRDAYLAMYRKAYESDPGNRELLREYVAVLAVLSGTERRGAEGSLDLAIGLLDKEGARRTLDRGERFLLAQVLARRADVGNGRPTTSMATAPTTSPASIAAGTRAVQIATSLAAEYPNDAQYAFFLLERQRDGHSKHVNRNTAEQTLKLLDGVLAKDPANRRALRLACEAHGVMAESTLSLPDANEHRRAAIRLYAELFRHVNSDEYRDMEFSPLHNCSALIKFSESVDADVEAMKQLLATAESNQAGRRLLGEDVSHFYVDRDPLHDEMRPPVLRYKIAYDLLSHGRYEAADEFAGKQLQIAASEVSNQLPVPRQSPDEDGNALGRDYLQLAQGMAALHEHHEERAVSSLEPLAGSDLFPYLRTDSESPAPSGDRAVPDFQPIEVRELASAALDQAYTLVGRHVDARQNADNWLGALTTYENQRAEGACLENRAFVLCRVAAIEAAGGHAAESERATTQFKTLCKQLVDQSPGGLYRLADLLSFTAGDSIVESRRKIFAGAALIALDSYAPIGLVSANTLRADPNLRALRELDGFKKILPEAARASAGFDTNIQWKPVYANDRDRLLQAAARRETVVVWGHAAGARRDANKRVEITFSGPEMLTALVYDSAPADVDVRVIVGSYLARRVTVSHWRQGKRDRFYLHDDENFGAFAAQSGAPKAVPIAPSGAVASVAAKDVTEKDLGRWAWIEGTVAQTSDTSDFLEIHFSGVGPNGVTAVIPADRLPALQRLLPSKPSSALIGARIKIWGVVEVVDGVPQILVSYPHDFKLIAPTTMPFGS